MLPLRLPVIQRGGFRSDGVIDYSAQSVRLQRKAGLPVQIRNFDWHASLRDFREAGTVEALWQISQPFVPGCGMALGSISQSAAAAKQENGECLCTCDDTQHMVP